MASLRAIWSGLTLLVVWTAVGLTLLLLSGCSDSTPTSASIVCTDYQTGSSQESECE
jgi:amino acid permease